MLIDESLEKINSEVEEYEYNDMVDGKIVPTTEEIYECYFDPNDED